MSDRDRGDDFNRKRIDPGAPIPAPFPGLGPGKAGLTDGTFFCTAAHKF